MDTTPPTTPPAGDAPGLVRRARRAADLSQRDLAAHLGVSQSRVARWETGRTSPTCADLAAVAALAGWEVGLVDAGDVRVSPMRDDAVRDRAGRRYPAHVDPTARGWWLPRDACLTAEFPGALARARATGDVRVAYDRGRWRAVLRGLLGTPPDHPTRAQLVESALARRG